MEAHGGELRLNRQVEEIVIEGGRAVGVRVRRARGGQAGEELEEHRADLIVSNAGAANTWLRLVPAAHRPPLVASLEGFLEGEPEVAHVSAYVGFRRDPRELGFRGENHWLYRGFDHEATWAARDSWLAARAAPMAYLSFPSLKDPDADGHTAEVLGLCGQRPFAGWRGTPWKRRGEDYEELKHQATEALLDLVEERRPGFRAAVDFVELSTPLTTEDMTGHRRGVIYGLPATAPRFDRRNAGWGFPRTPIPGLYQTGADAGSLGLMGALQGGLLTLSHLPGGVSMPQAVAAARRS
ncbi:MAG: hypothetical protein ISR76_01585 [Planctomycetes bacterium]|nr:hypothetical protein [Planctomycetota bacterium]MBL7007661.1 hypothetical protein [Planctomycetota bacterium]